jgi:hypothetical protein
LADIRPINACCGAGGQEAAEVGSLGCESAVRIADVGTANPVDGIGACSGRSRADQAGLALRG